MAIKRIIEEAQNNNQLAVLISIDLKKAFESIHRCNKIKISKAYGIPYRLLRTIKATYTETSAKVFTLECELFEILAGVLQGDTLALFRFVLVLNYAESRRNRIFHNSIYITKSRSGYSY